MGKLYMSYDNFGFEVALADGHDFEEYHTLQDQIEILCESANQDLFKGFCESYQIYNESGEIIFNSKTIKAA